MEETIRICKDKNVLKDYLTHEEVTEVMFTFVDKEKELKYYIEEERAEEHAETMETAARTLAANMGWSIEQAKAAISAN